MKVGYAVLYEDGELVISKNHSVLKRKIIIDYGKFEDINIPWQNESSQIKKVQISDQVKSNCMKEWFLNCINLTTLIDFKNLDVSDCTDFSYMFYNCNSLQNLNGLENWNVSKGIDFSRMFEYCDSLQNLNGLQNWNVSNCINFSFMFYSCNSLQTLNELQNWNVSNGIYFSCMFSHCNSLQDLNGLQNWNVSNSSKFNGMFAYCESLKEISLPNTLYILKKEMFGKCNSNLKIHWKEHIYRYIDLLEYGKIY